MEELNDIYIQGLETVRETITPNDFIIIGGGPVGFETALGLFRKIYKNQVDNYRIFIFEKRVVNTRKQILYMQTEYWNDLPIEIKRYIHEKQGLCIIPSPNYCYGNVEDEYINLARANYLIQPEIPMYSYVRLSTLQDAYINYFQNYGFKNETNQRLVYIVYPNDDENGNIDYYTSLQSNLFIVCDGAGGMISNAICGGKHKIKVSHAAVITFDFNMRPGVTPENFKNYLNFNINDVQYTQNSVLSFYTQQMDGSFSGYIGMQISEATFNDINDKFRIYRENGENKTKFEIFIENIENRYTETVLYTYLAENAMMNVQNQDMILFDITLSSSINFYKRFGDKYFFITGDAAFTTHFFTGTGMNRGLSSSIVLITLLTYFNSNFEFLATLYTLILQKIRNNLWKTAIPFMLYDFGSIMQECNYFYSDIEKINCIYSKTLSRQQINEQPTEQGQQLINFVDSELEAPYNNNLILFNEVPNEIDNIIKDVLNYNKDLENYTYSVSPSYYNYFNNINNYNIPKEGQPIATGGNNNKYYNKYIKYKQKYLSIKKLKK